MDIAVGAKQVLVMMTHVTKDGRPKLTEKLPSLLKKLQFWVQESWEEELPTSQHIREFQ
mgnify:CR=1 FL=1